MQSAAQLMKTRVLKNAVPEAANYPRALCNQGCKTHLYFKDGIPYEQVSGLKHECPIIAKAWGLIAKYNMVQIRTIEPFIQKVEEHIIETQSYLRNLKQQLAFQEAQNQRKAAVFDEKKDRYYQQNRKPAQ